MSEDREAPELSGVGIAEHDRALDVLAGVVRLRVALADIHERRQEARRQAWKRS